MGNVYKTINETIDALYDWIQAELKKKRMYIKNMWRKWQKPWQSWCLPGEGGGRKMGATYRVKVKDAAKEIGCNVEYLRKKMKKGDWDLGSYEKEKGQAKANIFIFRDKLDEFLGITRKTTDGDFANIKKGE